MRRYKHSLSHYKLVSCDMGELVPVGCFEVLPGDSIQQATSALVRASPLLAPVMHPVSVRIHHWFVPNRLVWDDWENFITGGSDGEGDGAVFPTITKNVTGGTLLDYLGAPPFNYTAGATLPISALPLRCYVKIYNEFYRDQDLVTPLTLDTTSGPDTTTADTMQYIAWEKDYFTSARPWPQKGPEVTLPLGTTAPVQSTGDIPTWTNGTNPGLILSTVNASGSPSWTVAPTATASVRFNNPELEADLSSATAVDVNTVRRAFALQRYQEARSLYGSRYTEYLRYLGVRSSDARLQRPEYLGGGKQTISFTEVLQTAPTTSGNEAGVADMKGHGIAAMRSRRYRRFFEEHGHVVSLMSIRPRSMYANGLDRMWSRSTKEDYWQKELEDIGQQEVYNKEVYAGDSAPGDVFGYQDRYSEYRMVPSKVHADFRSTLNDWHFARVFGSDQTLNGAFVTCEPSQAPFAASSADTMWIMVRHGIQARRLVKPTGIGRIL